MHKLMPEWSKSFISGVFHMFCFEKIITLKALIMLLWAVILALDINNTEKYTEAWETNTYTAFRKEEASDGDC